MIRHAEERDIDRLLALLSQVLTVHADIRPDLFIPGTRKYTETELRAMLKDESRPVFVRTDESGFVQGYAFCVLEEVRGANSLRDRKTLYIDDICVEEACRGQGVATELFSYVKDFARNAGCYHITLNVWTGNDAARAFYDAMGMKPLKTMMETIL